MYRVYSTPCARMCVHVGKTTLIRSLLRGKDQSHHPKERVYQIPGFKMYEAIGRKDILDPNNTELIQTIKQDAEVYYCNYCNYCNL